MHSTACCHPKIFIRFLNFISTETRQLYAESCHLPQSSIRDLLSAAPLHVDRVHAEESTHHLPSILDQRLTFGRTRSSIRYLLLGRHFVLRSTLHLPTITLDQRRGSNFVLRSTLHLPTIILDQRHGSTPSC